MRAYSCIQCLNPAFVMLKVMNICMQIVAYGSNGMVLVHYKGWKEKRREWIPRDRLTPIPTGDGQSSALVPGKLGRSHLKCYIGKLCVVELSTPPLA